MRIRLHLKIFIFIIIFIITKQIKIYGILMFFALIHELGHMIAGIALGFKPCTIEIMPIGISIAFRTKVENYNKKIGKGSFLTLKKIVIALAGPLTNFILAVILYNFTFADRDLFIYSNILIAIFNMFPIYPLDGGRILKGILTIFYGRKESYIFINKISNIIVILLTAICSIAILYLKNIAIIIILAYLWTIVIIENRKLHNKMIIYDKVENIYDKKI